jgi:hypothetical protein
MIIASLSIKDERLCNRPEIGDTFKQPRSATLVSTDELESRKLETRHCGRREDRHESIVGNHLSVELVCGHVHWICKHWSTYGE